jgi:hypothetical protein
MEKELNRSYQLVKIESGNVWSQLKKICDLLGFYIYSSPQDRKKLLVSR